MMSLNRLAAVLLAATLAACADAPTMPVATAESTAAALNTAPQPTVSNSGGYPLISWPAVTGASSYTVRYGFQWVTHMPGGEEYQHPDTFYNIGTTTGTSMTDSVLTYTGVSQCWFPNPNGNFEILTYFYEVTANFAYGTATTYVPAPVGPC